MKWLILLALIACGHKEPAPVYQDQDGDNIASPLEADTMYIANYRPLPKIEGKLQITGHAENKVLEASFTNESRLFDEALKVLSFKKLAKTDEQFFSENSSLRLKHSIQEEDLASNFFDVMLITSSEEKFELHLVSEEGEEVLPQKIKSLPRNKILAILNGSISLKIVKEDIKSTQNSIQQKTNRVFFYDGQETKIFYVSKLLSMEQIFDLLKVINPSEIYSTEWREGEHTGWWYQDRGANKSIVYASNGFLKERFLELMPHVTQDLTRIEGTTQNQINMDLSSVEKDESRPMKSKLRLRIKNNMRILRSFSNVRREISRYGSHGDFMHDCAYNERYISSESSVATSTQDILENLIFRVDGKERDLTEIVLGTEKKTVGGKDFLDIHLEIDGQHFTVSYKSHIQKDQVGFANVISGDICSEVSHYARSVSTEARWTIEAEVYQEI